MPTGYTTYFGLFFARRLLLAPSFTCKEASLLSGFFAFEWQKQTAAVEQYRSTVDENRLDGGASLTTRQKAQIKDKLVPISRLQHPWLPSPTHGEKTVAPRCGNTLRQSNLGVLGFLRKLGGKQHTHLVTLGRQSKS
jgi:hypothetical protein